MALALPPNNCAPFSPHRSPSGSSPTLSSSSTPSRAPPSANSRKSRCGNNSPTGSGTPSFFPRTPSALCLVFSASCLLPFLSAFLHQVDEAVDDGALGAAGLQPRSGDFVADLPERGIIGDVSARTVGVRHHDDTQRRLLLQSLLNHGQNFARHPGQSDIVDRQQAQSNVDRIGIFPLVFLARQRARFHFSARTGNQLLFAPNVSLLGRVDRSGDTYRFLAENLSQGIHHAEVRAPRQGNRILVARRAAGPQCHDIFGSLFPSHLNCPARVAPRSILRVAAVIVLHVTRQP